MKFQIMPILLLAVLLGIAGTTAVFALDVQNKHIETMAYMSHSTAAIDRLSGVGVETNEGGSWLPWVIGFTAVLGTVFTAAGNLIGKGGVNGLIRSFKKGRVNGRSFPVNEPRFTLAQPSFTAEQETVNEMNDDNGTSEQGEHDDTIEWVHA